MFALLRPKIYTCLPVGAHIKKLILDAGITACDTVPMISEQTLPATEATCIIVLTTNM